VASLFYPNLFDLKYHVLGISKSEFLSSYYHILRASSN